MYCQALFVFEPRGDGTIQDKETTDRYLKPKVGPARARCLDCISDFIAFHKEIIIIILTFSRMLSKLLFNDTSTEFFVN